MNRHEFDAIAEAVSASFGKPINQATKDRTFERVQRVPSKHVKAITEYIENLEKFPANLGNSIFSAWSAVAPQEANGDEDQGKWTNTCSECDPGPWKGLIVCWSRREDGTLAKFKYPCAVCQPSSARKSTRAELAAIGLMVPPNQAAVKYWHWRAFRANWKELAERVDTMFGGMLIDPRRMMLAAGETPDERGLDPK